MRIFEPMNFGQFQPEGRPDTSGVVLLYKGKDSLQARFALINSATKTLDLQYYAINNDITSNLLFDAILGAADRGVKVRLLIDDISIGVIRKELSALDCIEGVEVRIFNPVALSNQSFPARVISFFARLPWATRRMHNKALIVDQSACITGGRNLGDEYFDAHKEMSFKDVDVLSIGPVANKVQDSFEQFWDDRCSHPIRNLYHIDPSERYIRKVRRKLSKKRRKAENKDSAARLFSQRFEDFISKHTPVWARCEFLSDEPSKVYDGDISGPRPTEQITALIAQAEEELLIVSPYFVPGKQGCDWLDELTERGIHIGAVTNSLASTDVVAVHTGYKNYRQCLLESGISLYELKPVDGRRTRQRLMGRGAPSYASLHAKVYVVDRRISIVGSLNFDPRSVRLNTESALIIWDDCLGKKLADLYKTITEPSTSYKIENQDGLVWTTEKDNETVQYRHEPDASMWRRMQAFLIGLLPVENQL
jgi:putative cardiolipin synthase